MGGGGLFCGFPNNYIKIKKKKKFIFIIQYIFWRHWFIFFKYSNNNQNQNVQMDDNIIPYERSLKSFVVMKTLNIIRNLICNLSILQGDI